MDKDTNLSLNRLFHYTYSIDNLVSILKGGFQIKYSLEKLGLFESAENYLTDVFAIPMICFCDLPLNLVQQHTSVYGQYAIGLTKQWGEQQAICPVIYLPKESETKDIFENIARNINRNNHKIREIKSSLKDFKQEFTMNEVINLYDQLIDLIMYVKPYIGYYERRSIGFIDPNYKFYDEREWRYKPSKFLRFKTYLTKEEYSSFESDFERNKELGRISFSKEDLTNIIVPKEHVERIQKEIQNIERLKDLNLTIVGSFN